MAATNRLVSDFPHRGFTFDSDPFALLPDCSVARSSQYTLTYQAKAGVNRTEVFNLPSFFCSLGASTCQTILKSWKDEKPLFLEKLNLKEMSSFPTKNLVHVVCTSDLPPVASKQSDFAKVKIDFIDETPSQEVVIEEDYRAVARRVEEAQQTNDFLCLSDGKKKTFVCKGGVIDRYIVAKLSSDSYRRD